MISSDICAAFFLDACAKSRTRATERPVSGCVYCSEAHLVHLLHPDWPTLEGLAHEDAWMTGENLCRFDGIDLTQPAAAPPCGVGMCLINDVQALSKIGTIGKLFGAEWQIAAGMLDTQFGR